MIPKAANTKPRIIKYSPALPQYPISHNMCSRFSNGLFCEYLVLDHLLFNAYARGDSLLNYSYPFFLTRSGLASICTWWPVYNST
jgi:hypothetical protein